jgi:pimeloyl-ACP methyl ester carboxylesterase
MQTPLRVQGDGDGEPLLVLLHGLGATGDVWNRWRPVLARQWPGRWIAPDLPGHGGSPPLAAYTFTGLAAAVASLIEPSSPVVVLGHSLGGVVGLAMASGQFPVTVRAVIGLGIKTNWTAEELDRARALAGRPVTWFGSRDEAAARYLRVSGLASLIAPITQPLTPACANATGNGGSGWTPWPSLSERRTWRNCSRDPGHRSPSHAASTTP